MHSRKKRSVRPDVVGGGYYPGAGGKITEDDPRWNPKTMGNKRGKSKKVIERKRRVIRKRQDDAYRGKENDPLTPQYRHT